MATLRPAREKARENSRAIALPPMKSQHSDLEALLQCPAPSARRGSDGEGQLAETLGQLLIFAVVNGHGDERWSVLSEGFR